jgi:hypothetical protein
MTRALGIVVITATTKFPFPIKAGSSIIYESTQSESSLRGKFLAITTDLYGLVVVERIADMRSLREREVIKFQPFNFE